MDPFPFVLTAGPRRQPPARDRWSPDAAFTLIELLVVISLMAMLATLLLSAASRARGHAGAALCRNHLRQWGLGTLLYAGDHDDLLPPEGTPNPSDRSTNAGWYIQLPMQLSIPRYHDMPWRTNAQASTPGTVWLCPSNRRRSNGRNLFHYCLNRHIDGTDEEDAPVQLSTLHQPAELVWLFDSKNLPAVGYWNFTHTNLHSQGALFLFLDGHVSRFGAEVYWDPVTDRGRTNHPALRWIP